MKRPLQSVRYGKALVQSLICEMRWKDGIDQETLNKTIEQLKQCVFDSYYQERHEINEHEIQENIDSTWEPTSIDDQFYMYHNMKSYEKGLNDYDYLLIELDMHDVQSD